MYTSLMPGNQLYLEVHEDAIPLPVYILHRVYLDAGLPPDAALQSARADYEHGFSLWELKLI